MMEFAPDMAVIIADTRGNRKTTTVRNLLPDAFTPDQLPPPDRQQPCKD
jgi:cytidine deaminase